MKIYLFLVFIFTFQQGFAEDLIVKPDFETRLLESFRSEEIDSTAVSKMCSKYPKGIACDRKKLMLNRKKPCSCGSRSSASETKEANIKFLDYQNKRLTSDIARVEALLNPAPLKKWQLQDHRKQLALKKEFLKRVERYQEEVDFLPNIKLIPDDITTDFTIEDCGKLFNLSLLDTKFKYKKMNTNLLEEIEEVSTAIRENRDTMSETLKIRCEKEGVKSKSEITEAGVCLDCENKSNSLSRIEPEIKLMDEESCKLKGLTCTTSTDRFLKSVGINQNTAPTGNTEKDLSSFYSVPKSQEGTSACAGFAVTADIEAEIYKKSLGSFELPPPDPWETYDALNGGFSGCQGKNKRDKARYHAGTVMGAGFSRISSNGLCAPGLDKRYQVNGVAALTKTESVDFNFVKKMIDNEKPFMAGIKTTKARNIEDWVTFYPSKGDGHVLTVVGYGEGMSPTGNKSEPYVIVRDSLSGDKSHSKMRFEDFKTHLSDIWKVKSVSFK